MKLLAQSKYLESWRHFMPSSTRFQWRRIIFYGVCMSLFQNVQNLKLGELHQEHPGSSRRKLLAYSHIWWPGLDLVLEHLTKSCTACLRVKQAPAAASLHAWVWSSKFWQRMHIDFAGPFNRMFLLLVDGHSKLGEVINMAKSTIVTSTVAALWRNFREGPKWLPGTISSSKDHWRLKWN